MFEHIVRTPDERFLGLKFKEFKKARKASLNPAVASILNELDKDDDAVDKDYKKISDKIDYLILCFISIENKKKKVKELWKLTTKYYNEKNIDSLPSTYSLIINYIYSFSIESKLDIDKISKHEILLHDKIKKSIEKKFINLNSIQPAYLYVFWFSKRGEFLKELKISNLAGDSSYLRNIYDEHSDYFIKLRNDDPELYLKYINIFKIQFNSNDKAYKLNNISFYKEKCLEQIIIAKNQGKYDILYYLLEDYYKVKYNRLENCFLKYFFGYGEKPFRLIYPFIAVSVIYSIFFTSMDAFLYNTQVKSISTFFDKLFEYFLNNNTTMLTLDSNDNYYPSRFINLVVFSLQIIGFTITSSFVALYLRLKIRF
jgi:hypothetical protein